MLQFQQLPPDVVRSPAGSLAARRVVCMAAVSSSRVASCPGAPGRPGHEGTRDGPRQVLSGTGRDDPARRRLPVQSQEYGASLTVERPFTDPRRP